MSKLVATIIVGFGALLLLKLLIRANQKHWKNRNQHRSTQEVRNDSNNTNHQ